MESRKNLFKAGLNKKSKILELSQRMRINQRIQRNHRQQNIDALRNLELNLGISPSVTPVKKMSFLSNATSNEHVKRIYEYRHQKNLKKIENLQNEKSPFYNVVKSGVWLDKKENKTFPLPTSFDSPSKKILMSTRPAAFKNSMARNIILKSATKASSRKRSEVNETVVIQPTDRLLLQKQTENGDDLNTTYEVHHPEPSSQQDQNVDHSHIDENIQSQQSSEISLNSIEKQKKASEKLEETLSRVLSPGTILSKASNENEITNSFRHRLHNQIEILSNMIKDLERNSNISEDQKMAIHQFPLITEKTKKFEALMDQFENDREGNVTEEDVNNYWYLISTEINRWKLSLETLKVPSILNTDDLCNKKEILRRRLKKYIPTDDGDGRNVSPRRSMRLIANNETPKHFNCSGCLPRSASKNTPRSSNRKSYKKSLFKLDP